MTKAKAGPAEQNAEPALSQRKFAAEVGVSPARINQLVKARRLPVNAGGKIPLDAGKLAFYQTRDAAYLDMPQNAPQGEAPPPDKRGQRRGAGDDPHGERFQQARAKEREYKAKLAELEYKRQAGELVPVDEIISDVALVAGQIKTALDTLPATVAAECVGRTAAEIQEILAARISAALALFHESCFASPSA